MAASTYPALRQAAQQIRNEIADHANTAIRVGDLLTSLVDSLPNVIAVVGLSPTLSDVATATANTAALQAAVNYADSVKGKVVIPAGDFYFQHGLLNPNVVCQIDGLSFVCIEGAGVGVTHLHIIDGAESNMFNITGDSSYITIRDMSIDGNRANQTLGVSGIRGDAFSGLWLQNLYVHDIYHYGIGFQGFIQEFLFMENIKIENVGGDGFDQKNKADANLYQVANNIEIRNHGLNTSETGQAGWDCRGAWQISNFVCHFTATDGSGMRFRHGDAGEPDVGFGGHRSHVTNFEIYGPGAASTSTGIECVARDVKMEGGYVRDVLFGVGCYYATDVLQGAERCTFIGVTCESYGTAGFITSDGAGDNDFVDCCANGDAVGTYGFRLRSANNRLVNPRAYGNVNSDISLDTAAIGTQITNPKLVGSGSPGAAVSGLAAAAVRCTVHGGDITGHTVNCSVSATNFKAIGTRFRGATTDNVVISVGGDDADFIGCENSGATSEGYQLRAARTSIIAGQCAGNGGLGVQVEATATDSLIDTVRMTGNTADYDDQGTNTVVLQRGLVASAFNEAVAAAGTSANIDVPILPATTVMFLVEAQMEDSASARRTIRTKVQAYRSASGAAVVSAGTNEFTTGAGTLTINLSGSGNNLRVSVTNGGANNCRLDTRISEIFRQRTVEFT